MPSASAWPTSTFARTSRVKSAAQTWRAALGWLQPGQRATWRCTGKSRRRTSSSKAATRSTVSARQIELLEALGLSWSLRERGTWEDRLAELVAFRASVDTLMCPRTTRRHRSSGNSLPQRITNTGQERWTPTESCGSKNRGLFWIQKPRRPHDLLQVLTSIPLLRSPHWQAGR